jgi:hypothetical protein
VTDWSQLTHAYGSAEDVPDLLNRVQPREGARGGNVWNDLWSRLCHQGAVHAASYAALPALTQLAREWSPGERVDPLVLAGAIVASTDRPYGEPAPQVAYPTQIAELITLTEEALQHPGLAEDPGTYLELLAALLAFEGVEVWGEHLDGIINEEFEVPCPQCEAEIFVVFGRYGYFSTTDDMYMSNTSSKRIPLRPADPSALEGLGRRLYARALADGHPDLANKLTYVFGHAECVECGTLFSVDEAVVARG